MLVLACGSFLPVLALYLLPVAPLALVTAVSESGKDLAPTRKMDAPILEGADEQLCAAHAFFSRTVRSCTAIQAEAVDHDVEVAVGNALRAASRLTPEQNETLRRLINRVLVAQRAFRSRSSLEPDIEGAEAAAELLWAALPPAPSLGG